MPLIVECGVLELLDNRHISPSRQIAHQPQLPAPQPYPGAVALCQDILTDVELFRVNSAALVLKLKSNNQPLRP